ncbi:hypothetical protein AUK22_10750 [bacterium CG2_30_54_10]|nr:MAG: hypothetical protein AUK22_10750 [bacterium CG2_30_54_10]
MKLRSISNEEIRQTGLKALLRDLGPDGLIRFLQQFGAGSGDYTRDRHLLFPDGDIDSLFKEVQSEKKRPVRKSKAV